MRSIVTTSQGHWAELETAEDAATAADITETAIHVFFEAELKRRKNNKTPNRYFIFIDHKGRGAVGVSTGTTPSIKSPSLDLEGSLVTGYKNGNPYPNYGPAIDALGAELGIDLSGRYPYHPNMPAVIFDD